jgi:MoaA/NifB/PqqE/SkfB family radical SAM enzyme
MDLVRAFSPAIEITVRTVVSRVNQDDIADIGALLARHRALWDRWKLYQFTPVSIGAAHRAEHELADAAFTAIVAAVRTEWPDLPIVGYPSERRVGRYLFVGPEGNVYGVDGDGAYLTVGTWQELVAGQLTEAIAAVVEPARNRGHAQGAGGARRAAVCPPAGA